MVLTLSVFLSVVATAPLMAHTPVAGAQKPYASGATLAYKHGAANPSWTNQAIDTAFQVNWANQNNSNAPRFQYSTSGTGTATYANSAGITGCLSTNDWVGCADRTSLTYWKVWLRYSTADGGTTSFNHRYCEIDSADGCRLAKRTAIIELEHIALGVWAHDPQSPNWTLMSTVPNNTVKPNTGWDYQNPRECDESAAQLKYGLKALTGSYAGCFDHISGAGTNGLQSTQTVSSTTGDTCAGLSVSRSGRLAILSTTSYESVSGLALASRTIYVDRKIGTGGWTLDWASQTTTSAATGYNWTRSFSENPAITTTYSYRIHFKDEGVDAVTGSTSATLAITFHPPWYCT